MVARLFNEETFHLKALGLVECDIVWDLSTKIRNIHYQKTTICIFTTQIIYSNFKACVCEEFFTEL